MVRRSGTPEGAGLITCFRVLSKRTEPMELQGMMPALMKLATAMRSENKRDEIAGAQLRDEAKFLYQLARMSEEELLEMAKLVRS
jgi:hypothetical protein